MKGHKAFWALVLAGAAAALPLHQAHAGDQYQSSIVLETGQTPAPTTTFAKSGKLKIAPSAKAGDGGVTMQLTLKGISCGSKCTNNVLAMGTRALGTELSSVVGLLFNVDSKGTALWPNGKNKAGFGTTFGPLTSAIFNNSLGIGAISLHETASDPSACSNVPLAAGNDCTDGASYAVAGFKVPVDTSLTCAVDADCELITSICNTTTHFCETQKCSSDGECNSGHCDINGGQCCADGIGNGCP